LAVSNTLIQSTKERTTAESTSDGIRRFHQGENL